MKNLGIGASRHGTEVVICALVWPLDSLNVNPCKSPVNTDGSSGAQALPLPVWCVTMGFFLSRAGR